MLIGIDASAGTKLIIERIRDYHFLSPVEGDYCMYVSHHEKHWATA